MKHVVKFERVDFTQKPPEHEVRTVEVEFPPVDDDNVEKFEELIWSTLMAQNGTGVRGHFSSWGQVQ